MRATVSYSVRFNGKDLKPFVPECGLRQGDPLSPYLFILCMQALSGSLHEEEDSGLTGLRVSRSEPVITHQLFADDAAFSLKFSDKNVRQFNNVLHDFCQASGQIINREKCSVLTSQNCREEVRSFLNTTLGMPLSTSFGTYLGIPSDFGVMKRDIFKGIIKKMEDRLLGWNSIFLSASARLSLVRAVLSSLSNHVLSVFRIPKTHTLGR